MTSSIRALLRERPILVSPGVYDGYSARLAARAGFALLSTTGAGLVNSRLGLPDVGIFSLRDNVDACRAIVAEYLELERRFLSEEQLERKYGEAPA